MLNRCNARAEIIHKPENYESLVQLPVEGGMRIDGYYLFSVRAVYRSDARLSAGEVYTINMPDSNTSDASMAIIAQFN